VGAVDICRALGRIVITPRGEFTSSSVRSLHGILQDLIEGQGNLAIIVDAMFITSVDERIARVFADAAGRMSHHNGTFVVASANERVRASLEAVGVSVAPA